MIYVLDFQVQLPPRWWCAIFQLISVSLLNFFLALQTICYPLSVSFGFGFSTKQVRRQAVKIVGNYGISKIIGVDVLLNRNL